MRSRIARLAAAVATLPVIAVVAGCGAATRPPAGVSPLPGTPTASATSRIGLRSVPAEAVASVGVVGAASGRHSGRLIGAAHGASFVPSRPFSPGERVDVAVRLRQPAGKRIAFHFGVARPAAEGAPVFKPVQPQPRKGDLESFRTLPAMHAPKLRVTSDRPGRIAAGYLFLAPQNGPGQYGPMIADAHGRLVWFAPLTGGNEAFDFRVQGYDGRPVLTWWQGRVSSLGHGTGTDVIVDSSYRPVATVAAGNGYRADLHEFKITALGTALITAYEPVRWDLAPVGGDTNGVVLDSIVQEVDIRTGAVLFEWHSLGHVGVAESYAGKPTGTAAYDYFHVNSVDVDGDGNLLISARNTWAVYKVDRQTGRVIWRLGGKRSDFEMGTGTRFAWQHDARRQPDGTITLFDDEAAPKVGAQSRGLALALDERARTARLARQYVHPSALLAASQGNMQALANGDELVGWGQQPNVSEFDAGGRLLFDATLPAPDGSYRAYKLPWSATPAPPPRVVAEAAGGATAVYASWNGATGIGRWRVLGGPSPDALAPLSTAAATGFETSVRVSRARYVAVEALSASGRALGRSRVVRDRKSVV